MARTEIEIIKAFVRNDPSAKIANTALFRAVDATDGAAVKLDTKDENTIFVAQNTANSDGELVILAGDGPCGAVDLKITVPASSTVCFALDSACFKRVTGEDKGKVVMTGPATIGVAAFYAP